MKSSGKPGRWARALVAAVAFVLLVTWVHGQEAPAEPVASDEASMLLERIEQRRQEVRDWEARLDQYSGDDRRAVDLELRDKRLQAVRDMHRLAAILAEREQKGEDAVELRAQVEPMMRELGPAIREHFDKVRDGLLTVRGQRDEASPEEQVTLERRIGDSEQRLIRIAEVYLEHIRTLESLDMPAEEARAWLEQAASDSAELLSRRIELAQEEIKSLRAQAQRNPDNGTVTTRLAALEERQDGSVKSLRSLIDLLREIEVPTTQYQQLIARTTGDFTVALGPDVAFSLVGRMYADVKGWVQENGTRMVLRVVLFVLVLLAFWVVAWVAHRLTVRALASSKVGVSKLLESMITAMVRRTVLVFGFLVALSQIGVSLGPVLAGLGVAGFVIGFALQDVLSNFASGVMILFYRPFDVDDLVEVGGGVFGKVNRMTLVSTTILTLDYQTLIIPNSKIWGDVIKNVTAQKIRRVDLTFGISYSDDIPKAEKVLTEIVTAHPKALADPEPVVKLHELGDSSVNFIVRPWVNTADYWEVYWDVTREVKMRFDREGISIPFPQRAVHLYETKKASAA